MLENIRWLRRNTKIRVKLLESYDSYKKIFVAQGFYSLSKEKKISLSFEKRTYFEKLGLAPEVQAPYFSDKNIVPFIIETKDRTFKGVYDANDYYYKIPPLFLRWCDTYFKSNYQPHYYQSGKLLNDAFWSQLKVDFQAVPEPLDLTLVHKIKPCSFSMELFSEYKKNEAYFNHFRGKWLKEPFSKKSPALFYQGRYWQNENESVLALFKIIESHSLQVSGGIVSSNQTEIPDSLKKYETPSIPLDVWNEKASLARISLMTRGLHGCLSFKPLNFALIGSPFIAHKIKAQPWEPFLEGINYFSTQDDFSDFSDVLKQIQSNDMEAIGQNNLKLWDESLSPKATAEMILREAIQ